jgi:hypothetical protein
MSTLKLADALKLSTSSKCLGNLTTCILNGDNKAEGWLYDHFNKTKITAECVLLNFRALLAIRCMTDSDLLLALSRSLVGKKVIVVDASFIKQMFPPSKNQFMNDTAVEELLQAFENPTDTLLKIKNENNVLERGWIRLKWFSLTGNGKRNLERMTNLEADVFQTYVYLVLESLADLSRKKAIAIIDHAWAATDRTILRHLENFRKTISDGRIPLLAPKRGRGQRKDFANDHSDPFANRVNSISVATPSKTRATSAILQSRGISSPSQLSMRTPRNEPHHQTPPKSKPKTGIISSVKRIVGRVKAILNLRAPFNEIDDDSNDSSDPGARQLVSLFDSAAPVPVQMGNDSTHDKDSTEEPTETDDC